MARWAIPFGLHRDGGGSTPVRDVDALAFCFCCCRLTQYIVFPLSTIVHKLWTRFQLPQLSCSTIVGESTNGRFLCDCCESKTFVLDNNCGTIVDSLHNCGPMSTIVEAWSKWLGEKWAVGGVLAKGSKRIVDFVHNLWTIVDHRGTILWTFAQLWTTYFS